MVAEHEDLAAHFERWYSDMAKVSVTDEIQQRHLGLPPELLSTSLLTWDGIEVVAEALAVPPGGLLVDLACGRGGYGLELAARAGARLIGIDFAPSALEAARALAATRADAGADVGADVGADAGADAGADVRAGFRADFRADFRVGDLVATGLPDGEADAVVVVDAIQFPEDPASAYREIARILRPGGRVVLTGWEPVDPGDERVPERLRRTDLTAGLVGAGFRDVEVTERADWRAAERAMWAEAAALDPGDDPALQAFHEEGVGAQDLFDRLRRVLGTATR